MVDIDGPLSCYATLSVCDVIGECLELWDDPAAWQHHVAAKIESLVGGFGGAFVRNVNCAGSWTTPDAALGDCADEQGRVLFDACVAELAPATVPGANHVFSEAKKRGWFCRTHVGMSSAAAYYRSGYYQRFMRPLRALDALCATVRCSDGAFTTLAICRSRSDRPFSSSQRSLLAALVRALGPRIGTRLATRQHQGRHALSPRERQTLSALLQGDSEKELAYRLGIAPSTAHDYVKAVYRFYGVRSRGELMACHLERRPRLLSGRS